MSELLDHLRRVPDRLGRGFKHLVGTLGQDLGVVDAADDGFVVDAHDLFIFDQAGQGLLSVISLQLSGLGGKRRHLFVLEHLLGLDVVVEEFALIVLGRRENAGRGKSEHQDKAEHEHRELLEDHGADVDLLGTLPALEPDVPDGEPQHDDGQEQHAGDVEDFGDLQRLDAVRLISQRRTRDLRRIEDAGAGPGAELDVAEVEHVADNREQEHAADAPQQDGADGVGDLDRLGIDDRRGGNRGRHAANTHAGRKYAGHGVGYLARAAQPQHHTDGAKHEEADHHRRQLAKRCQLAEAVERAQQDDARFQAETRKTHAVLGPFGNLEHIDDNDTGENAEDHVVEAEHLMQVFGAHHGAHGFARHGDQRGQVPAHDHRHQKDENRAGNRRQVVIGVAFLVLAP